jgi:hypothetical protein
MADDFGIIFALINSQPHLEHFPLMIALLLASLTYLASAIETFCLQWVQYVSRCMISCVGIINMTMAQ